MLDMWGLKSIEVARKCCPWVELYKTWNTLQKGLSVSRVSLAAYLINRVVTQFGISVFTFLSLSALTGASILYAPPLHALTCLKEKSSKSSKACRDWNQMHFWKQLCWKGKSIQKSLKPYKVTLYTLWFISASITKECALTVIASL